ncbi:hypothetical protein NP233_g11357 [Leucocoprinus birnbaumii]|uniref:Uncharacterized protein n=1 Tax=Leucocoprinus birnbaumii TaxID=56174 RepID=A0AAD5VGK6_9AGAR|nr:hypothetical protein NP233_g11357 [Leucocoprinus birnbaumii]
MANIYSNLDTESFTLRDFASLANDFHSRQKHDEFVHLGLTGIYHDDYGEEKQAFIDVHSSRLSQEYDLQAERDIDSVIGISKHILVAAPISIGAVPDPTCALSRSIHFKYHFSDNNISSDDDMLSESDVESAQSGQRQPVDYHRIPNFEFGSFGDRKALHVFFPKLCTPERLKNRSTPAYQLTQRERELWYEKGLRPAIESISQGLASEWPATYETEIIRGTKHRGRAMVTTKMIAQQHVRGLMDRIRLEISNDPTILPEDVDWARNFFVMHTIRGVKHAFGHEPSRSEATEALDRVFRVSQLSTDALANGSWYVDVGLELSSAEGMCLQWNTAGHHKLVSQALHLDERQARTVTRLNSSKYYRDLASHLPEVSGFRLTLTPRSEGEYRAVYIQAYTTDKAVTYNQEGFHHAKHLSVEDAMGKVQPSKMMKGIHKIYQEARTRNPSKARLEIRVPYHHASQVLVDLDYDAFRSSMYAFDCYDWWDFRTIRIMACSQVFDMQQIGISSSRFMPETLLLTAACIWLVNGLHARPEDGPAARDLMRAVLPVTEVQGISDRNVLAYSTRIPDWQHEEEESGPEDESPRVPYIPYGCIFLRRIMLEAAVAVPRMRIGGPDISLPSFSFWFSATIQGLQHKYQTTGIVDQKGVREKRSTTNKCPTTPYSSHDGQPEPDIFSITERRMEAESAAAVDGGSDLEDRPTIYPNRPQTVNAIISDIWRQFVKDIKHKSPNPQGSTNPSYLRFTEAERQTADDKAFHNLQLAATFRHVWYLNASEQRWRKAFDWLFPPPGFKITGKATYGQCLYYRKWMAFLEAHSSNHQALNSVRNELFKRMNRWAWIPFAQQDKIWRTAAKPPRNGGFTRWPEQAFAAAPHILLHHNATPIFPPIAADEGIDEDADLGFDTAGSVSDFTDMDVDA